jgi:uncharacterized membrane protein
MINKNIKFKTGSKVLLSAVFAVFAYSLICLFAYSTKAQQILPLSVVPPKQEILVNPGETYTTEVKFANQSDTNITGTLTAADFIVEDNNGTPVFLDNPQVVGTTTIPAKYSAAQWTKLSVDKAMIQSKSNFAILVTINVPKNAAAGGRYVAVLFQPDNDITVNGATAGQIEGVKIRLASLIYIRVAGPITEAASVTKFAVPNFLEYGPVSIATSIINKGDYHITPQGTITMTNMFGKTVAKADLDSKNIFPGTSRDYTTILGEKMMMGKFTVALNATYGDMGNVLTSTSTMWIFPWKISAAVLLAIIIVILLIVLLFKKVVKKEAKLVEELKEEKTELEALKEKFEDKLPPAGPTPPTTPPAENIS